MKKIIVLFCVLSAVVSLSSCQQKQVSVDNGSQRTEDIVSVDTMYSDNSIYLHYNLSENVFTGELLSYEYTKAYDPESVIRDTDIKYFDYTPGEIAVKVKIDGVFKGEYVANSIVDEIYPITARDSKIMESDYLEVGQRYLFMLGKNEKASKYLFDYKNANELLFNSHCKAIKIFDDGILEYYNSAGYPDTFEEFLRHNFYVDYWAFLYQKLTDYDSKHPYTYKHRENMDREKQYYMQACYLLADNVYYGDVVEGEVLVDNGDYFLYKVKVRVMTVFKGEYTPGEIIEDVSWCKDGFVMAPPEMSGGHNGSSSGMFFTGDKMIELFNQKAIRDTEANKNFTFKTYE